MKFSTMFYTVFDLNGMLKVGTFFKNYQIERSRKSFSYAVYFLNHFSVIEQSK